MIISAKLPMIQGGLRVAPPVLSGHIAVGESWRHLPQMGGASIGISTSCEFLDKFSSKRIGRECGYTRRVKEV